MKTHDGYTKTAQREAKARLDQASAELRDLLMGTIGKAVGILEQCRSTEAYLKTLSRETWPEAKGILAAKCKAHGPVKPVNIGAGIFCPACLEDPHIEYVDGSFTGPSLEIVLEEPVNFIKIESTVSEAPS